MIWRPELANTACEKRVCSLQADIENACLKYATPGVSDLYPILRVDLARAILRLCEAFLLDLIKSPSSKGALGLVKGNPETVLERSTGVRMVAEKVQLVEFFVGYCEFFEYGNLDIVFSEVLQELLFETALKCLSRLSTRKH